MVKKIIAGAYNEVERGALDFAADRGIPHGGWTPVGWRAKVASSAAAKCLQEVPHSGSPNYAERNIFDADGTLLLTGTEAAGAAELARNFARRYRHPLIHIDLSSASQFQAAQEIAAWIAENGIRELHVTGGGPHQPATIYETTQSILASVFSLQITTEAMERRGRQIPVPEAAPSSLHPIPRTLNEALDTLTTLLSLKDKARIGRTPEADLAGLYSQLGPYIEQTLGWWRHNDALLSSCRQAAAGLRGPDTPDQVLIHALWLRLRKTYGLRVID